jgi:hypothetical protein
MLGLSSGGPTNTSEIFPQKPILNIDGKGGLISVSNRDNVHHFSGLSMHSKVEIEKAGNFYGCDKGIIYRSKWGVK